MRVQRGLRQMQVVADQEELEESFHLNVLDSDAGIHMETRILSSVRNGCCRSACFQRSS